MDDDIAKAISERTGSMCTSYVVCATCEQIAEDDPTFHTLIPLDGEQLTVSTLGLLAGATVMYNQNLIADWLVDDDD